VDGVEAGVLTFEHHGGLRAGGGLHEDGYSWVMRPNVDAKLDPPWLWMDVVDGSRERARRRAASTLVGIFAFPVGKLDVKLRKQRALKAHILS
jgi:hypothetical protein